MLVKNGPRGKKRAADGAAGVPKPRFHGLVHGLFPTRFGGITSFELPAPGGGVRKRPLWPVLVKNGPRDAFLVDFGGARAGGKISKSDPKTRGTGKRAAFFQLDPANSLLTGLWPRAGELEKGHFCPCS